ncbi:MAG: hypothetical protein AB9M60_16125 [Leptothrix sp. (in: b-proteobacteria)]
MADGGGKRVMRGLGVLVSPLVWLLRGVFQWLLALMILFEEWGWDALSRALERLAQRFALQRLEAAIRRLSPHAALALFVLPTLLLVPVKLAALWLIAHGRTGLGVLVIVLAKLAGTALLARLFLLTQAQLMQLAWFARLYGRWTGYKQRLLDWLHGQPVYRVAKQLSARLHRSVRALAAALRKAWRGDLH